MTSYIPIWAAAIVALTNVAIAVVIYCLVSKKQTEITRLNYLKHFEDEIFMLCDEPCVKVHDAYASEKPRGATTEAKLFRFRNVLNEDDWYTDFTPETLVKLHHYMDGDNWVQVRLDGVGHEACKVLVSSRILHRLLSWFQRVNRAIDHGMIKEEDLTAGLHRIVLAFIRNRRYIFLKNYFPTDFSSIQHVCAMTWRQYVKNDWRFLRKDLEATDDSFLQDIAFSRRDFPRLLRA